MSNVQHLFWCDVRDEQGGLVHAPDCDQHDCFVIQRRKQETNTVGKAKMPDHYRCTITCAFCGKRRHYEDECYHKQRLSSKLRSEAKNGGGSAGGKSDGMKGKGTSQGRGNCQAQAQSKGGGRRGPDKKNQDENKDKNEDRSRGNPNSTPGGNLEPSGGQQDSGPTTCFQTQAQQEHGTKRANQDGDESNARKCSRFMRMAQQLRKMPFDVTCPAKFRQGRSGGSTDLVFWVCICLLGRDYLWVLDTDASISIVAKKGLPRGDLKNIMPTAAIRMGDGHVGHSCGDREVDVPMGSGSIAHRFFVIDTEAFHFVLGKDFFGHLAQILSLTLQAPYLLHMDHGNGLESVPLEQSEHTSSYVRVCKKEPSTMMVASKTEDYQLLRGVLDPRLKKLEYSREDLNVEPFASDKQHVLDLYCSKGNNCCYKFYWPSVGMPYGNPRFSELGKVLQRGPWIVPVWTCALSIGEPTGEMSTGVLYWRSFCSPPYSCPTTPSTCLWVVRPLLETKMGEHAKLGGRGPSPSALGGSGPCYGPRNSTLEQRLHPGYPERPTSASRRW